MPSWTVRNSGARTPWPGAPPTPGRSSPMIRVTRGEGRCGVAAMVMMATALQLALPDRLTLVSKWMLPGLEAALLLALIAVNPTRLNRESAVMRGGSLALAALVSVANGWSAALLSIELVGGRAGENAGPLLSTGA